MPSPKTRTKGARRGTRAYRPPSTVMQILWAPMRRQLLTAALENGYFDALKGKPAAARTVARATATDPRAARMVLDVLVAEGLLVKSKSSYRLTRETELFLTADSPLNMAGMFAHGDDLLHSWPRLAEVMRSGTPLATTDDSTDGEAFFRALVSGLFAPSFAAANLLAKALRLNRRLPLRVLDVAGGSAAWSLAFVTRHPQASGVVVDRPAILPVAREFVERYGVADRYEYLAGDIRETTFARGEFDLIILGHICHSEGAQWSRRLIRKCAPALKPGGWLVIPDMVPNDARTGPLFPLLFAVTMLLNTRDGDTFTAADYRKWLTSAGLKFDRLLPASVAGSDVIIARKPDV